ncbi:AtpZ/AtpI family protein [Kribbella deserti]|uniref:AtpZ/AtpI family protein n=1 Tax=Kribbella deserti TaxID=1926257 RepID=A0ABV6QQ70_9ACTN
MSQQPDPPPPPSNSTDGWRVLSYLIGGLVLYAGIGWMLDRWLDTSFFLPAGIVLGAGLAVVLIYFRYRES